MTDQATLREALTAHFGYESFRGRQEGAIAAALAGKDVLLLMPTGGGKSLCYTLPALLRPGTVLVVSPLIALMEDQVAALHKRGIACDMLCSATGQAARADIIGRLLSTPPALRMLFVTPELIGTDRFQDTLATLHHRGHLTLFAIDEAHCISSWGHDFRSAYRKLSVLRRCFGGVPIMALTATASAKVQDDIVNSLKLRRPERLISSFDRPNINFSVQLLLDESEAPAKVAKVINGCQAQDGGPACGIVYALKRTMVDDTAAYLRARGVLAEAYHAGLPDSVRSSVLADWTRGAVKVVVATVAFGMGIDNPGVRFVVHLNMPKSLSALYQEAGRAGRDSAPACSVVMYSNADYNTMTYILDRERKGKRAKQKAEARAKAGLDPAQAAFAEVVKYCTKPCCRRRMLLGHFGEEFAPNDCGNCDWCADPGACARQLRLLEERGFEARLAKSAFTNCASGKRRRADDLGRNGAAEDAEASSGAEEGDEKEETTAAVQAVKRVRQGGGEEALLSAMQAAEESFRAGKGEVEGKKRQKEKAAAVTEAIRESSRARLVSALAAQFPDAVARDISAAAQAMEAECHTESQVKSIYLSALANRVRSVTSLQTLPRACDRSSDALLDTVGAVMDVCDARALAGPNCEAEAVRKLGQLACFPVSVELLQSAGKSAVKQIKGLAKQSPSMDVRTAADAVIRAWKSACTQQLRA